jgi:hypothetical protein
MHAEIGTAQIHATSHVPTPSSEKPLIEKNINAIKDTDILAMEKNLSEKSTLKDLLN